jgi:uncharacterized protein (DUF2141 family)
MNFKKNLHWLIYILFIISCAKQSSPTGGPKDTIPPKLLDSQPRNEAINFKGKTLELTFSEMIALNNPKEQLIITPSVGKDFELKARRNLAILELKNALEDSTTYTFNFRDAVQDVTEKNIVKKLQLAISTGTYIDSLSIEGSVHDILKGKKLKEITVAIYPKNDTFSILKHPAMFFTKSDDKGIFKIDHLKPGVYYIYAIDDKNKNLFTDSRTESYAFLADSINLLADTSRILLGLVRQDTRPLRTLSARPYNTYFNIKATKNLKDFTINTLDSATLQYSFGEDQANIKLYNTFGEADSVGVHLFATDSIDNKIDTVLYAKFLTTESTPEKFDASVKSSAIFEDKGLVKAILQFSKPLTQINFDSVFFEVDSTTTITFDSTNLSSDKLHNTITLSKTVDKKIFFKPPVDKTKVVPTSKPTPLKESVPKDPKSKIDPPKKIANQFYFGKAAFISIDSDSSKKFMQTINPHKTEDLSIIFYDITTTQKNIVVQLIDKTQTVIKEISDKPKGEFTDLTSGEYLLRVIIDSNNNNKWDPGNYFLKREPEQIHYYKGDKGVPTINLKANWELVLSPMLIKP